MDMYPKNPEVVPVGRGPEEPLSLAQRHHVEWEPEWNPAFDVTSHCFKVQITFKHLRG